ncbi:MAG: hypothetical protein WC455_15375 [Dehalococcoidia bacterium]|jgi:hypothetical protein
MKRIDARLVVLDSEDDAIHLTYTPDQTQLLKAGTEYEIVLKEENK